MKRAFFLALVGCFCLMLASCGGTTNKDKIIGKWKSVDEKDKGTVEFTRDGKMIMSAGGLEMKGDYKFTKDDEIEVSVDIMGQKSTQKMTVSITGDELTTTDEKKKTDKFKKVS